MSKKKKKSEDETDEETYSCEFNGVVVEGDGEAYLTDEIDKVSEDLQYTKDLLEFEDYPSLPQTVKDTVELKIRSLTCYLDKLNNLLDTGTLESDTDVTTPGPEGELPPDFEGNTQESPALPESFRTP